MADFLGQSIECCQVIEWLGDGAWWLAIKPLTLCLIVTLL